MSAIRSIQGRATRRTVLLGGLALSLAACQAGGEMPTTRVDPRADRTAAGMALDDRDFSDAAGELVRDMLASGRLRRPDGGRYVMAISRLTNDTQLRINMDELVGKVRVDLLNSGQVIMTTAVGLGGPEDPLAMQVQRVGAQPGGAFATNSGAARGNLQRPNLSLSGSIIQRNTRVDGGAMRIDYTFRLVITDLSMGLAIWEGQRVISRVGSGRTVAW